MSATQTGTGASDVAASLRDAEFVRIVARADGDGLAAAGTLARALDARGTPFQVSAARTVAGRTRRVERARSTAAEGDVVALIGDAEAGSAVRVDDPGRPASVAAWAVARVLGDPDPVLALAGAVAAGATPTVEDDPATGILAAATEAGLVERRPGVAVPTDDPVDGLAHSTLVHAPFSGDTATVAEELGVAVADPPADEEAHRRLGSAVALSTVGAEDASERAATVVERALRPHATEGPFATVEGYADVLAATARDAPGTGIAVALGHDAVAPALSVWREHGRAAHRAVRSATTARYDGLLAARIESGPIATVARLLRDYRSPEPVVLVVTDGEAAAVGPGNYELRENVAAAVASVGGEYDGTRDRAYARVEDDPAATIAAFREAIGA